MNELNILGNSIESLVITLQESSDQQMRMMEKYKKLILKYNKTINDIKETTKNQSLFFHMYRKIMYEETDLNSDDKIEFLEMLLPNNILIEGASSKDIWKSVGINAKYLPVLSNEYIRVKEKFENNCK